MMSCSSAYAPIRWLLRDPTLGHAVMHPIALKEHGIKLTCAECLKSWTIQTTFAPSPVFTHRQWLARIKGVARVLSFQKRKAS